MSTFRPLPASPSLEHLKNEAKTLLKSLKSGDSQSLARLLTVQSGPHTQSPPTLAQAQLVIARDYGFPSWTKLKAAVISTLDNRTKHTRLFERDATYYDARARGLLATYQDGNRTTLDLLREWHPLAGGMSDSELAAADFGIKDVRLAMAREHGEDSWDDFVKRFTAFIGGKVNEPFADAFEAIQRDDLAEFKSLIGTHPDLPRARGTNGNRLLNLAISLRRIEAIKLLIKSGADVNAPNHPGWTPLHDAVYSGQLEIVEMILDAGGNVDACMRGDGGTPLMLAIHMAYPPIADKLAGYGTRPHNLRVAAGLGRVDLINELVREDGTLTDAAGSHRGFYRVHSGYPQWKPSNTANEILDEALTYASRNGRIEAMNRLVKLGARVDGEPYFGTALHWAAGKNQAAAISWLVVQGVDVNLRSRYYNEPSITPLHVAAWGGHVDAIRVLLAAGADATLRDTLYFATPLGWANFNRRDAAEAALLASAKIDIFDAARFGVLDRIRELCRNRPSCVNEPLLLSPSDVTNQAFTLPIYQALDSERFDTVAVLLECGANPNPPLQRSGKSPLALAEEKKLLEIAGLLRSHGAIP